MSLKNSGALTRATRQAMNARPFKSAEELQDMIVEQARTLQGPEGDIFYRTRTLALVTMFKVKYDLDGPRLWSTTISSPICI